MTLILEQIISWIICFLGLGELLREISLPEQNEDILKCMLNSTVMPSNNDEENGVEIDVELKPNFPFDLATSTLIEGYMCRIHKTLQDKNGHGLPLELYLKAIRKVFRDRRRVLPQMFCGKQFHAHNDLECNK